MFETYGTYWNDWDNNADLEFYHTTQIINGEIEITFHDLDNYVIAGTFWFDAINQNGDIIKHETENLIRNMAVCS